MNNSLVKQDGRAKEKDYHCFPKSEKLGSVAKRMGKFDRRNLNQYRFPGFPEFLYQDHYNHIITVPSSNVEQEINLVISKDNILG